SPARAFYQGADLLDGDVSLPPPRRGGPLVADAEADLGRALRLDRVADENGIGRCEVGETGQQRAIGVPRATEAEVPAQEEDGAPAAVVGRRVEIAAAGIEDPPLAADADRAGRRVDGGYLDALALEPQSGSAGAGAEVESGPLPRVAEELPFPPVPFVEIAEEPLGPHGLADAAPIRLELGRGHPHAPLVVEEGV